MAMTKKRFIFTVTLSVVMILLILLTGCSSEEESKILVPDIQKDVYVYDQGDFISDDAEVLMNKWLVQLEKKTTIEFAVITIPSLNDLTIEKYAYDLGNELGIGKADEDNGILLLISREDTRVRLEIGSGLQGVITDGNAGQMLDKFFVPYRDEDNYDAACTNTVQGVINFLSQSEEFSSLDFSIEGIDSEIALDKDEVDDASEAIDCIIALIVLIAIVIFLMLLVEWITGSLYGDGFGTGIVSEFFDAIGDSDSGSGGFGGGDFFGGGGFNGGGASR